MGGIGGGWAINGIDEGEIDDGWAIDGIDVVGWTAKGAGWVVGVIGKG